MQSFCAFHYYLEIGCENTCFFKEIEEEKKIMMCKHQKETHLNFTHQVTLFKHQASTHKAEFATSRQYFVLIEFGVDGVSLSYSLGNLGGKDLGRGCMFWNLSPPSFSERHD